MGFLFILFFLGKRRLTAKKESTQHNTQYRVARKRERRMGWEAKKKC